MAYNDKLNEKPIQNEINDGTYIVGVQRNEEGKDVVVRVPATAVEEFKNKNAESAANTAEESAKTSVAAAKRAEEAANEAAATVNGMASKNDVPNAVKGTLLGAAVAASDVSPNEHDLSVNVSSKNLIPYPYSTGSKTNLGITFTVNDDRTITVSGTAEAAVSFVFANKNSDITLENGKYYTLSGAGTAMAYQLPDGTYKYLSANKSVLWSSDYAFVHIYYNIPKGTTLDNVIIPAPQFEVGTSATEYAPYVDVEGVTVSRCGKNLFMPELEIGGIAGSGANYNNTAQI
ncbi:MAG: hypothetical protein IJZ89_07795, partial [Clostridia bacterium]|nr:hypothetical protein [Clostridia bacterium]